MQSTKFCKKYWDWFYFAFCFVNLIWILLLIFQSLNWMDLTAQNILFASFGIWSFFIWSDSVWFDLIWSDLVWLDHFSFGLIWSFDHLIICRYLGRNFVLKINQFLPIVSILIYNKLLNDKKWMKKTEQKILNAAESDTAKENKTCASKKNQKTLNLT